MRTIQHIINLIVIPLYNLIFIAAGIFAALLSALIEYCVFREFFTSEQLQLIPIGLLSFTLVFCMEFTKVYLHFLQDKLKQKKLEPYGVFRYIPHLTYALVSISIVCSIIFSVTTLDRPTYNEDVLIAEENAILEKLENDIDKLEKKCDAEFESNMLPYQNAINDLNRPIDPSILAAMGPLQTKVYFENLEIAKANVQSAYNNAVNTYRELRQSDFDSGKLELETTAQKEIDALYATSASNTTNKYDNKILSSFLSVLTQVFFGTRTYSRVTYLSISVLLGVAVSLILEIIISISTKYLSMPLDFLVEDYKDINQKLKNWSNEFVLTCFKTFCAIAVYIFIVSIYSATIQKNQLYLGFIACMLATFLVSKYIHTPEDNISVKEFVYYEVRNSILQGVISLIGYILLGFAFGADAMQLDMNTIAVGIGSSLSGGIAHVPNIFKFADSKSNNS